MNIYTYVVNDSIRISKRILYNDYSGYMSTDIIMRVPYNHSLSLEDNHKQAVRQYCKEYLKYPDKFYIISSLMSIHKSGKESCQFHDIHTLTKTLWQYSLNETLDTNDWLG